MTKQSRPRSLGLSTLAIHGDREGHEPDSPIATPLFQSVNYVQHFGTDEGLRYSRYGNTPNAEAVQKRLALIEGSEAACIMSSGMGATACGLLALLRPGDHLLASQWLYGGTLRLLLEEFIAFGITVTFVDPTEPRTWRKRLRKETRAIFLESPVNPTCRVVDIRPVAYLAHEEGLALVVDSTFASPVNFRPLQHGADVVIHSATKFLNGHHDVLAGVVCGTTPYIDEVRQKMVLWGQSADPFACWLLERGLKTLEVRVRRQNETAGRIAEWCTNRKEVKRVHYPGLKDHADHKIATELLDGFGGMLAIELAGGGKAAEKFVRKLRLIQYAASLGGVDTILSEPRYSSHAKMTTEQRTKAGIPDGFLRLSVGLEDADDIIADIEQAL
jgi:cystathionine beta-lyase/cystathionine gamma-synthase